MPEKDFAFIRGTPVIYLNQGSRARDAEVVSMLARGWFESSATGQSSTGPAVGVHVLNIPWTALRASLPGGRNRRDSR